MSLREAIDKEIDRLNTYLHKSYKAKVRWSKTGSWEKAIQAEIGSAIALGRLDLVSNLMERRQRIMIMVAQAEQEEYEVHS